ncbi:hypothetical protein MOQ_009909, partial [Trypanosoma cruzi marinkellei]
PWLSAGTHSPHTSLQPRAVYASADTASSSRAHTHAELLRLPSISRGRDGGRVVVVVGASVVVVLGASGAVVVVEGARVVVVVVVVGACVMAFVVLFTESSLFLSDFPAGKLVVLGPAGVTTATVVDPGRVLAGGATSILPLFLFGSSCSTIKFCCCTPEGSSSSRNPLSPGTVFFNSFSLLSVAHTDGQQHRASTNRAHSRRHVIIIVSVVVRWCGADLHSEGHGEQQERREVRQTHTEGTPHEERAAARHA